ncbi:transferase hexapeptide repeat protein [Leptospira ryugenii]|uniref:Transferase hexapeptide repeat protein n=1 Tax=Leptospira ryugenii TaxID=1917863 RepID=A0A2P2DVZ3_9LEPT|nr:acetyltransferase [Leptospira ryugenii]GBF48802.1 transferase hexapeptide repeat protein [Leptospira ryugenii]
MNLKKERETLLVACGGHGRVVLDSLLQAGIPVSGIIDRDLPKGTEVFGIKVLGDDSELSKFSKDNLQVANGFGFTKSLSLRVKKFEEWECSLISVQGIIHPQSIISSFVQIDRSAQVLAGVIIQNSVSIGKNVVVNTGSIVEHDVVLGDHSFVSPGVTICGGAKIGISSFIGAGSVVLPGVAIGNDCIIGAGSIVNRDVENGTIAFGNPARSRRSAPKG